MTEFAAWPVSARLFITLFFAVCVLTQMLALILSRYRGGEKRPALFGGLLELSLLLQILCMSLLHGQVYHGLHEGYIAPTGYAGLRIAAFLCVAVSAGLAARDRRSPLPLLSIASGLILLPPADGMAGRAYPWLFMLSLCFLFVRSVCAGITRYRQIQAGLSALSVKEAVDNLRTGILFYRPDGQIVLMNAQMQRLMTDIGGRVCRNGRLFYERLISGGFLAAREGGPLEGQDVFLLPDGSAWIFTRTDLFIRRKQHIQLTATDVSERFRLTAQLREQDAALRRISGELKSTISQLHTLSRERETQRAKMRAHDVLGQRLTLLLRMVRGDRPTDLSMLNSLIRDLPGALAAEQGGPSPESEIEVLSQIFGSVGVSIRLSGRLPEDAEKARVFAEVIRECVANALRHGFATEVNIHACEADGCHRLSIDNNGHPPPGPIVEGGGLGGLRRRLGENGGTVETRCAPRFTVVATLPGGEA